MPKSRYRAVARPVRRFFAATGIPVPRFARRAHRRLGVAFDDGRMNRGEVDALRAEMNALRQRIDRVETAVYLDSIGRRSE